MIEIYLLYSHSNTWLCDTPSCKTNYKYIWFWFWYLAYEICLSDGPGFSYWKPCRPQSSDTAPAPSCNAPYLCLLHQGSAGEEIWNYFQEIGLTDVKYQWTLWRKQRIISTWKEKYKWDKLWELKKKSHVNRIKYLLVIKEIGDSNFLDYCLS